MFGVASVPWSPLARGLLTRSLAKQKASKRGEVDKYVVLFWTYTREHTLMSSSLMSSSWMPMYDLKGAWFEIIVNRSVVSPLSTRRDYIPT